MWQVTLLDQSTDRFVSRSVPTDNDNWTSWGMYFETREQKQERTKDHALHRTEGTEESDTEGRSNFGTVMDAGS